MVYGQGIARIRLTGFHASVLSPVIETSISAHHFSLNSSSLSESTAELMWRGSRDSLSVSRSPETFTASSFFLHPYSDKPRPPERGLADGVVAGCENGWETKGHGVLIQMSALH
ncbi:hypothetical protein SRHO_G00138640 [Serrasalmus rhombeus]